MLSKSIKKRFIPIITLAITGVLSLASCSNSSDSSASDKNGSVGAGKSSSSKEAAVENFFNSCQSEDIHSFLCSMAPKEYWDYCISETGLPEKKLCYKILNIDSDEEFANIMSYEKQYPGEHNLDFNSLKIDDSWLNEEDDYGYSSINGAFNKAGLEDSAEVIYYLDTPSGIDLPYEELTEEQKKAEDERVSIPDGFLYQIDGKWYYGPESIFEDAIELIVDD